MDKQVFEHIDRFEETFSALIKLGEEGLSLCEGARHAARLAGLVPTSKRTETEREFNARMTAKLIASAERKRMNKINKITKLKRA